MGNLICWRNPINKDRLIGAINAIHEMIVYDLETSGLSPQKDSIIQLAAVRYKITSDLILTKTEELDIYIKPKKKVSEKIQNLTGITNDFLSDKADESEVFSQIKDFFGNTCVCGYNNSKFDDQFMQVLYKRYGESFLPASSFDVMHYIRDVIFYRDVANYKLETTAIYFGCSEDTTFHSAIDDARATGLLLQNILTEYSENTSEIINTPGQHTCIINQVNSWQGKSYKLKRIYVQTNRGNLYFDCYYRFWMMEEYFKCNINLPLLEKQVLLITGCETIQELAKFEGCKKRKTN